MATLFIPLTVSAGLGSSNMNIFKEVIEALGAAGDAIVKLTDGIKHLVSTGNDGYEYVSAKREHARLKDLSARLSQLSSYQNVRVVENIDEYLQTKNPSPLDWHAVQDGISQAITEVYSILKDVREERSDFVLEEAYFSLSVTINSRAALLSQLQSIPQPKSTEELKGLSEVNDKYKILIKNLNAATKALNEYLKKKSA